MRRTERILNICDCILKSLKSKEVISITEPELLPVQMKLFKSVIDLNKYQRDLWNHLESEYKGDLLFEYIKKGKLRMFLNDWYKMIKDTNMKTAKFKTRMKEAILLYEKSEKNADKWSKYIPDVKTEKERDILNRKVLAADIDMLLALSNLLNVYYQGIPNELRMKEKWQI